jgi:hypothetical protein
MGIEVLDVTLDGKIWFRAAWFGGFSALSNLATCLFG